ncbi:hypothetical protein HaLaN_11508, partial [Haematococcus lacustris]
SLCRQPGLDKPWSQAVHRLLRSNGTSVAAQQRDTSCCAATLHFIPLLRSNATSLAAQQPTLHLLLRSNVTSLAAQQRLHLLLRS